VEQTLNSLVENALWRVRGPRSGPAGGVFRAPERAVSTGVQENAAG
jgi:hypothetical protein